MASDPGGHVTVVDSHQPRASLRGARIESWADVARTLGAIERFNEAHAARYSATSPSKLRWRAHATRHALHITPGDRILEIGAGAGRWTKRLASVLHGECEITAAVFNSDLATKARAVLDAGVEVVDLVTGDELVFERYDHVVGSGALSHDRYWEVLSWVRALLRPGGQILLFEANHANPLAFMRAKRSRALRGRRDASNPVAVPGPSLVRALHAEGFVGAEVIPYDILPPRTPRRLVRATHSATFVLEHLPAVQSLCSTVLLKARATGAAPARPRVDLAGHPTLRDAVSVVVPCHNESMNITRLVDALTSLYDGYIREIIVVDDNSDDDTAVVVRDLARHEPRMRLVSRRPPAGVGRALRDGYAAATGSYILSIDCDFEMVAPELEDLFEAVASGRDGAIGSRFSYLSVLLGYPAGKLIGNRLFHLLVRLLLRMRVRDISNNLKLYRADILWSLEIEEDGFAANAETGLKPLLEGCDIAEIPIAWINRSDDMGASTFGLTRVAPGYVRVLLRSLRSLVAD